MTTTTQSRRVRLPAWLSKKALVGFVVAFVLLYVVPRSCSRSATTCTTSSG